MTDRYRDRSDAAACGVVTGLVLAGIASWAAFALAFFRVL